MEIRIITSHENAHTAEGLAVVIDVVRAFTTASYILHNHAKSIIAVGEIDAAQNIKGRHPDYILVGEHMGVTLPGFDYGNSPTEIATVDFTGKTVVMRTTAGTQGVVKATNATEIIACAFVNARATAKYIQQKNPKIVSFICTDDRFTDSEDVLCAQFITGILKKKPILFSSIQPKLEGHVATRLFLKSKHSPNAREDLDKCFHVDTFHFIAIAKQIDKEIHLLKQEVI